MVEKNPGSSQEFKETNKDLLAASGKLFEQHVLRQPEQTELSAEVQKAIHDQPPVPHDQREW